MSLFVVEIFGPKDGSFGTGNLEDVRVSGCDDPPCKLRKGAETTISFDFVPGNYKIITTNKHNPRHKISLKDISVPLSCI